jgi:hypothetical protein
MKTIIVLFAAFNLVLTFLIDLLNDSNWCVVVGCICATCLLVIGFPYLFKEVESKKVIRNINHFKKDVTK